MTHSSRFSAAKASRVAIVATVVVLAAVVEPARAQSIHFSRPDLQRALEEVDVVALDGTRWTADALKGRVVLLEFWATWCAPCLQEIPLLRRLRDRYGPDRFEILGVSLNSSARRDLVAWLNRQGLVWPQIHDGRAFSGRVARIFGVSALPASILVNQQGRVVAANLRGAALERAVRALVQDTSTRSFDAARMPMVRR